MKKILSIVIVFTLLISTQFVGYCDDSSIQVVVDGSVLEIKPEAKIINGSTYIPMVQFVKTDSYQAEVQINSLGSANEYIINRSNINRVITITESKGIITEVTINGIIRKTNIKVIYEQGQLWVPIVFLVEHLGGQAAWSELTRRVMVESYKPILFSDEKLEAAIRSSTGVTIGDIFKCDLDLVSTLVVSGIGITNLDGLQYASNIIHLDLSNNNITDVTSLRPLSKLTNLYLKGNPIDDYSPLAAIYNQLKLRDFNIGSIGIYDRNVEAAIREEIGKYNGSLTLEDMQAVLELNLENKNISDLQGIQYLTNLKKLNLRGNSIKFIKELKNLTELEVLALNNNKIDNIESLSYITNLVELDFPGNNVTDIAPLTSLAKLKQLSLMDNNVSDISNLGNLVNLEILVLQNNEISDISALEKLVNLNSLYLSQNNLVDISMLAGLDNLEILVLKDNQIADVRGIGDKNALPKLKKLFLLGNLITDYSPLKSLYLRLEEFDFPDPNKSTPIITASPVNPSGTKPSPTKTAKAQPTPSATKSTPSATPSVTIEPVPTNSGEEIVQRFYINKPFYFVNDIKVNIDVAPIIKNGRTFLPVRYVAESLGANVAWNEAERKITVTIEDTKVEMLVDTDIAMVNGRAKEIDEPPFIEKGRTLVPFRFLSESLGCKVEWDDDLKSAIFYNAAYVASHPEKFIQ
jgi:Leucine-rich repeat (LRR) protein